MLRVSNASNFFYVELELLIEGAGDFESGKDKAPD